MTASGISVTYGPEANIPRGAVLEAEEILEGTAAYESYIEKSLDALSSDEVTSETGITDKYCSIPLSKSPREWAETIIAKVNSDFEQERECYSDIVKSKEYDISISAEKLKDIYMEE